ncbi:MAG: hypothetical protein ABFS17_08080 [Chloroflexota bacterium]
MKSKAKTLIFGVLIVLTIWQGAQFVRFAADEIPVVWTWIGKPVQWRSAAYTTSENFADYIEFANHLIPGDAAVAIPSNDLAPWNFSFKAYLQFLLIPREVFWCSDFACLKESAENGAYVLIENTPATIQKIELDQELLIQFNARWAILTPEGREEAGGLALHSFGSVAQIAGSLFLPLLWLTAVGLPGLLLTSTLLPSWRWLSRLFLGLTLGLGVVSVLIYLGLLVTKYSSVGLILGVNALWWFLAGGTSYWLTKPDGFKAIDLRPRLQFDLLEIGLVVIALMVAFLSIAKGYWGTDGIVLWGVKGYGISYFGLSEGVSAWGTLSAKYPLELPILISVFKTLFGDLVPESKILPVIFYLGLPLIASEYFRVKYQSKQYGWLLLLWVISPQIILQGSIGYANLAATFYLVSAVLIALLAFQHSASAGQKKGMLALSGALFVLAAWTRPEGAILSAVLLILFAVWKKDLKANWMLYTPLMGYALIWSLTADLVYSSRPFTDGFLTDGLWNVILGKINYGDLLYLIEGFFNKLLNPLEWGLIGWLILAGLGLAIIKRGANPETNFILFAGALLTVAAAGIIYLKGYNPMGCDVSCMVRTAMERLILPGIGLLWLGASDYLLDLMKENKKFG